MRRIHEGWFPQWMLVEYAHVWRERALLGKLYKPTCELGSSQDSETSPCSHFDHCERPAVVWIYEGEPQAIYGFCQTCYDFCFPGPQWYRICHTLPAFNWSPDIGGVKTYSYSPVGTGSHEGTSATAVVSFNPGKW